MFLLDVLVPAYLGSPGQKAVKRSLLLLLLSGTTRVSLCKRVKPIWILLKQETVSGSGISWDICKSASRSRQITMPVPQWPASRDQPRLDRRCHQPVVKASYDGVTGTRIWNID